MEYLLKIFPKGYFHPNNGNSLHLSENTYTLLQNNIFHICNRCYKYLDNTISQFYSHHSQFFWDLSVDLFFLLMKFIQS